MKLWPRIVPHLRQGRLQIVEWFRRRRGGSAASAEPVRQLTSGPTPTEQAAASGDRRSGPRYEATLEASCRPILDQKSRWQAQIHDVSQNGLRLVLDRRFETGVLLHVEVSDAQTGAQFSWLVKTRWVRELVARKWSVGCVFNQEMSAEDLRSVLALARAGTTVEAVAC